MINKKKTTPMKSIKIEIVSKKNNCLLLDLGINTNSKIYDLIAKQDYANICRGKSDSDSNGMLQSYMWVEIQERDIKKLEDCLNDYINNAR